MRASDAAKMFAQNSEFPKSKFELFSPVGHARVTQGSSSAAELNDHHLPHVSTRKLRGWNSKQSAARCVQYFQQFHFNASPEVKSAR